MNTYVKRALRTTLVASGLVLAGTAAAHAADTDGIANGSEVTAPVTVDVDLSGLSLGLLGDATSTVVQPAPVAPEAPVAPIAGTGPAAELPVQAPVEAAPVTDGIANGTDVTAPVAVDLDLSGIAVGVVGDAESTVVEAPAPEAPEAAPAPETAPVPAPEAAPAPAPETAPVPVPSTDGIANGTDVTAPVDVDVDLSGLALGVIGDATSTTVQDGTGAAAPTAPVGVSTGGLLDGLLNDLGVTAPVSLGLDLSGIAVGVIGDAESTVVTPGQPVTPVDPVDPTEPTEPTEPTTPVDPTDPVDPTSPVDPTDTTDPTDPVGSGTTGGGAGGTTTVGSDGSAVIRSAAAVSVDRQSSAAAGSGWTAQGAPSSELAHTGTQAPGLLALTGLLLLAGLVLRRTALRGRA